jgi:hypothetical protein
MEVRWIQVWAAWWVVQDSNKLDPVLDNFINTISVRRVGWHSKVSSTLHVIQTGMSDVCIVDKHVPAVNSVDVNTVPPINNCHSLLDIRRWNIGYSQELSNSRLFLPPPLSNTAFLHCNILMA